MLFDKTCLDSMNYYYRVMNTVELIVAWLAWKSRRDAERYTQKRLAIEAGVAESTISFLVNGKSEPDSSTLQKISTALGISVAEFWAGPEAYNQTHPLKELHEYEPGERIPGLGVMLGPIDESETVPLLTSIPAGDWKEWHDPFPPGFGEETIPRYGVKGDHVFTLRVNGDSMVGEGLHDGDILYINPEIEFTIPRAGRIGVVRFNGSYKIRRVFISRDGERYRLVPGNPIYEEEEVPARETVIFKIVRWMPNSEGMF